MVLILQICGKKYLQYTKKEQKAQDIYVTESYKKKKHWSNQKKKK